MKINQIKELVHLIKVCSKGKYISTAESCTGGMLASYLTSIPGSSEYFAAGIVSYSNKAKINLLGVSEKSLEEFGAVSEDVAKEMALGALRILNSDIAVSITGVAGPDGGTKDKPVGMVCFAVATKDKIESYTQYFSGNRDDVRMQSCYFALKVILQYIISN